MELIPLCSAKRPPPFTLSTVFLPPWILLPMFSFFWLDEKKGQSQKKEIENPVEMEALLFKLESISIGELFASVFSQSQEDVVDQSDGKSN